MKCVGVGNLVSLKHFLKNKQSNNVNLFHLATWRSLLKGNHALVSSLVHRRWCGCGLIHFTNRMMIFKPDIEYVLKTFFFRMLKNIRALIIIISIVYFSLLKNTTFRSYNDIFLKRWTPYLTLWHPIPFLRTQNC